MVALANMISDQAELLRWAATAKPRGFVTYHVGNLSEDRAKSPALHDIAEIIRLLQETNWLIQSTQRINLAGLLGRAYFATRTGGGYAPKCILTGSLTARQYRALKAMRDRIGYQSAHRAIRDELSTSETDAAEMLAYLYAHEWIEKAPEKGYRISHAGVMQML